MKKEQLRLFDLEPYELKPKFTAQEKANWSKAFKKWADQKWKDECSLTGIFCCGYMRICDLCESKFSDGCKDCVESVKEWYRIKNKDIDYKDYDFDKIIKNIEEK